MNAVQSLPIPMVTSRTVIVNSDSRACLPNGQIVINLSRQPLEVRRKKMALALSTFREYGWSVDDRRKPKEVTPAPQ